MIKNKFAKWIEWLLDLLPLFAVLFSCLYVTFNKNALYSYSGTDGNYYNDHLTMSDIELNDTLHFSSVVDYNNSSNVSSGYIQYSAVYNIDTSNLDINNWLSNGKYFNYYARSGFKQLYIYDTDLNVLGSPIVTSQTLQFDFVLSSYQGTNFPNTLQSFSKLIVANYGTLDSVFTYSLSQFNDLGFDKLNFINWFTGLFLNGTSNVYTTFINGYLNYFLLVECTYVLPMVLYWFIHLGERLISKLEYGGDK